MAATTKSKFPTILDTKIPNKITRALIYAFLEWTLISFILLHSLFSLFLLKFARFFGLQPPCFLCSRLDSPSLKSHHHHDSKTSSFCDVVCEQHASEISKLGYCSNHRKLVEFQTLCEDCSPSSSLVGFDDHDVNMCSCCGMMIIKPPITMNHRELIVGSDLDPNLEYQVVDNHGDDHNDDDKEEEDDVGVEGEKEPLLIHDHDHDDKEVVNVSHQNLCPDMLPQHIEFYIDHDDYRLIPVDMVNFENLKRGELSEDFELVLEGDELVPVVNKNLPCIQEEEEEEEDDDEENNPIVEDLSKQQDQKDEKSTNEEENKVNEGKNLSLPPTLDIQEGVEDRAIEEQNWDFQREEGDNGETNLQEQGHEVEEKMEEDVELCVNEQEDKIEGEFVEDLQREEESVVAQNMPYLEEKMEENKYIDSSTSLEFPKEVSESHLRSDKTDAERSEDTTEEIPIQVEEPTTPCKHETSSIIDNVVCEVSTTSAHLPSVDEHDDTGARDCRTTEAVITERSLNVDVGSSNNEVEEERIPDTPTSIESLNNLHKKLYLLGRRESVTEESLDGSIASEHESGGDAVATVEKLKSELQAERKALRALYKELEEERNAAAIATNHTMAMITRLQEEKATMQMEALQYQRMMEEQSEYDQEALQMMNELMVKREKEKQELEKELELYRKKLIDYEERERLRILSRRREGSLRSRNSSASCSYGGEESDGLSIDLNHEAKDNEEDIGSIPHKYHDENGQQDTPADAVINLQDSLAGFEEERNVILEQLKVLEEKLFTLAEEEEEHIVNMKPFEQFCEENGKYFEDGSHKVGSDANGHGENGFSISHVNEKHHHEERRINGSMQKRLLPLFDATELEDSFDSNGNGDGFDSLELHKSPMTRFELEKKRLAIEEEVDHVYERLHALEADREFLKHCIGSLRKGDKGLDLLQEILQHLRDLKSVELQVMKNMDHCISA